MFSRLDREKFMELLISLTITIIALIIFTMVDRIEHQSTFDTVIFIVSGLISGMASIYSVVTFLEIMQ